MDELVKHIHNEVLCACGLIVILY